MTALSVLSRDWALEGSSVSSLIIQYHVARNQPTQSAQGFCRSQLKR